MVAILMSHRNLTTTNLHGSASKYFPAMLSPSEKSRQSKISRKLDLMRKSFIVLVAIFVCVLATTVGVAQTQELDATASYQERLTADSQATTNLAGPLLTSSGFSSADIVARISEAQELLSSKLASSTLSRDSVRLAALDPDTSQLDIFSLAKDEFLTKD